MANVCITKSFTTKFTEIIKAIMTYKNMNTKKLNLKIQIQQEKLEKQAEEQKQSMFLCEYSQWDYKRLCESYEDLNTLIEDYGISLDIKLTDNTFIHSIKLIDRRQFYDSCWRIVCNTPDKTNTIITITRREDETYKNMINILNGCNSIKGIKKLDLRDQIYYD